MADESDIRAAIARAVTEVRTTTPLVPSITNTVTQNFVANAQLACGGSAAMVYLPDEGEAMATAGSAMYINMGTLMPVYEQSIPRTARALHSAGKPWVLDPVGIGIGGLRTKILSELRECPPTIVRGNASEIIALAGLWDLRGASADDVSRARGVDTTDEVETAQSAACALARFIGGAVAVSGPVDLVTDGNVIARAKGGSPLMARITGSGCSLGGVCAVYASAANPFTSALAATAHYNVAGTRAAEHTDAPGSFYSAFIDELYRATPEDIAAAPTTFTASLD